MTGPGHHLTGIAAGLFAAGLARHFVPHVPVPILLAGAWFGGVAPDRLEFPARVAGRIRRAIPHRTITHWWALWAALGLWATFVLMGIVAADVPATAAWAALGAACGALTHLLCDWPNPTGVPSWTPWRRHSLRLWPSGEREFLLVAAAFGVAAVPWIV